MLLAVLRRIRSTVLLWRLGTPRTSRRLPTWVLCRLYGVEYRLLSLYVLWNSRLQQLRCDVVLRIVVLLHMLFTLWQLRCLFVMWRLRNLFVVCRRKLFRLL